jgi:uncharacterized membrane protein HdeD (DUF308 family)
MTNELARNWWALAVRGAFATIFGLAAIIWPGKTLSVLLALFGIFLFADGIFAFITAVRAGQEKRRWWTYVVEGLVEVGLGIWVFANPSLTALVLLYVIAFWAIFIGIWRITAAIELRRQIQGEWLMAATGVISLIFGFAILAFPSIGILAFMVAIGIFALAFGVLSIILGFRLRSWSEQMPEDIRRAA